MKASKTLLIVVAAITLGACTTGGGGGGGGSTPTVAVSIGLDGPEFDPTGVAVSATPSNFPGSGAYTVSWTATDLYARVELPGGDTLPTVIDLGQLQTQANGAGKSVQLKVTATYSRGGRSATGETVKELCWVGSPSDPVPC